MRNQRTKLPFYVWFTLLSLCSLFSVVTISAQVDDPVDPNAVPPPVKVMSKGERAMLDARSDVKERTKLALELMSARLTRAEAFNAKGEFGEMYTELGGFHALMDDTLEFLTNSRLRDNVLNNFKRLEIGLRAFGPRLGLIRRELPQEYDPYVRTLLKYVRDARSKAVEPLFGDSVVPQRRTT
jgi:hypothetical protein